jgi:hypothetical protein
MDGLYALRLRYEIPFMYATAADKHIERPGPFDFDVREWWSSLHRLAVERGKSVVRYQESFLREATIGFPTTRLSYRVLECLLDQEVSAQARMVDGHRYDFAYRVTLEGEEARTADLVAILRQQVYGTALCWTFSPFTASVVTKVFKTERLR